MEQRRPLPRPSPARGRPIVPLPPLIAAKLALYEAMLEREIGAADLARRMAVSEAHVQRLLDLDHRSDISQIGAALTKLGKRLEIRVSNAA
jgi:antitoxin HicB